MASVRTVIARTDIGCTDTLRANASSCRTVRVASSHDASRKLRRTMWGLTVLADGGKS